MGCDLLTRDPKGTRPTPAGETLLHHTRRMLASAEQIALELAEHARRVRGFVRVLANLSAIVPFLPEDLKGFLGAQPAIRVDLEERPSGGVVAGVEEGAAHLGIRAGGTDTRTLRACRYRSDRLVLVLPAGHPLADRAAIALAGWQWLCGPPHRPASGRAGRACHARTRRRGRPPRRRLRIAARLRGGKDRARLRHDLSPRRIAIFPEGGVINGLGTRTGA